MRPITLAGFDAKFADSDDPWQTFEGPDEILKRKAILHAMGPAPWGRVLELAAGNGSNSAAIAPRALRFDATEATESGAALVKKAVALRGGGSRAGRTRVMRLAVPARLPRQRYDGAIVAELIYYLTPLAMGRTARDVARAIRPGGVLVLAHHRIDFPDFAQHAATLQRRFLAATRQRWRVRIVRRTGHWVVLSCRRGR
ncbi:class I SAM-dependent methyltransferase [Sphingomonas oligophenolica]|uniref:Class I SAM-dependent methyltransferase n=1 Tax=Sphingomonas oligophenolica TaxID=301154 RepID=A0A502C8Y2_9SPHN|nr:class I SAM-dependent methyltransferase [Sphingomonas oligophenolica]